MAATAKYEHQPDFGTRELGIELPDNGDPDDPVTLTVQCVCGEHAWTVEVPAGGWRRTGVVLPMIAPWHQPGEDGAFFRQPRWVT